MYALNRPQPTPPMPPMPTPPTDEPYLRLQREEEEVQGAKATVLQLHHGAMAPNTWRGWHLWACCSNRGSSG